MSANVEDYADARELIDSYHRDRCPTCGTEEWFKTVGHDYEARTYHYCQSCSNKRHKVLEYPCPECGLRMIRTTEDKELFRCQNPDCDCDGVEIDTDALIDRLSGNDHHVRGMPGVLMGDCPICGSEKSVNGGPDGEVVCGECNFYAGQYMDVWFCYAIWRQEPEQIRVRQLHD